jgi:hypothetical protein
MHHYMRDRVSYVTLFLPPVDFHSYTIMAFYLPLEVGSLSPLLCEVVHAIRPCPSVETIGKIVVLICSLSVDFNPSLWVCLLVLEHV